MKDKEKNLPHAGEFQIIYVDILPLGSGALSPSKYELHIMTLIQYWCELRIAILHIKPQETYT